MRGKNMRKMLIQLLAVVVVFVSGAVYAAEKVHWGYSGHDGPEHWSELDRKFAACSAGKNQSPINLTGFIEAELESIQFYYKTSATEVLNNGHTIQVNYAQGSSVTIANQTFELKQFHFHSPSENHIEGKSFPMEAHLVHADKNGNLAVVAVMFEEGNTNSTIKALWSNMPEKQSDKHSLSSLKINAMSLLPNEKSYYRFNGSLTTPPCTEGVEWFVMKQPVTVSKQEVEAFEHVMHHSNNRSVQLINARVILQ